MVSKTCPTCEKQGKVSYLTFQMWGNSASNYFRDKYKETNKGVWYCCCGLVWVVKENKYFNVSSIEREKMEAVENATNGEEAKERFVSIKLELGKDTQLVSETLIPS